MYCNFVYIGKLSNYINIVLCNFFFCTFFSIFTYHKFENFGINPTLYVQSSNPSRPKYLSDYNFF